MNENKNDTVNDNEATMLQLVLQAFEKNMKSLADSNKDHPPICNTEMI